jgi:NAD(P)H-dependent flavin oxidoreductase YrpB (nitropropane dioxygenase family)
VAKEDHVSVRDDVIVSDPFGRANPRLVVAAARSDALGVLDLGSAADGSGERRSGNSVAIDLAAIDTVNERTDQPWAVRLPPGWSMELPAQSSTVILAGLRPVTADDVAGWPGRRVLVEVTSLAEAEAAAAAGAAGLLVKGCEAGGRVGHTEGFVLAQQVARLGLVWWLASGVGIHTAGVAAAAGACGVAVSDLVALVAEVRPDLATATALAGMDGSETCVIDGHQVWSRPGSLAATLAAEATRARRSTDPADHPADDATRVAARLGDDVRYDLVAAGPDTAMASQAAEQWGTIGGVVAGFRQQRASTLDAACRHLPLAPYNLLARRHGLRCGVAQGPMTRVSDRAPFAAAVADSGGLPFLALALLSGPDTRELLEETASALGDRPWASSASCRPRFAAPNWRSSGSCVPRWL